jgi:glutamate synthase domain-containing protein 3
MTRAADRPDAVLSVPDIRDYDRINAELVQRLDEGARLVRLAGAEGQRLLASGLKGTWNAVVEVEGRVGPEFAAEVNAPGLTLVCHGAAADGAGRSLRAGCVAILGDAGVAIGYAQEGGTVVVAGSVGPRAGLNQRGGDLVLLGDVGPLAAERQSGGRVFVFDRRLGPHAERGRRAGKVVRLAIEADPLVNLDAEDASTFRAIACVLRPWLVLPGTEA